MLKLSFELKFIGKEASMERITERYLQRRSLSNVNDRQRMLQNLLPYTFLCPSRLEQ